MCLNVSETFAANQHGANFGQADSSLAIYDAKSALTDRAPPVDRQSITWAHNVIRPRGDIHRNELQITSSIFKNFSPKSFWKSRPRNGLDVHIVERRNIVVRTSRPDQLRRGRRRLGLVTPIERRHRRIARRTAR